MEINRYKELLNFLPKFKEKYEEEKAKLPYHINILDEIWANENAHSRILARILEYRENGKSIFLESFLKNIGFTEIPIDNLVVQKVDSWGGIDIPICDKKHFIIIENKINWAKEQNQKEKGGGQLARYINQTIQKGFEEKNIFVIYTPEQQNEPSDEIWDLYNEEYKYLHSYKKDFQKRYKCASYKEYIYKWLKDSVLPQIKVKDTFLHSALLQYIDYLDGRFGFRTVEKQMNMELEKLIKDEFRIDETDLENSLKILTEKQNLLSNLNDKVIDLRNSYEISLKKEKYIELFSQWKNKLKDDFPSLRDKILGDMFVINKDIINLGVKFEINGDNYAIVIECNDVMNDNLYVGIGRQFQSNTKHNKSEELDKVLNENELDKTEPDDFFYGWKYTHNIDNYEKLKQLIENIIK